MMRTSGSALAVQPLPDGCQPGLVLEGFEAEEISRAVGELLHDPARLARMSAAAGQRAEERISFERMLDEWEWVLAGPEPLAEVHA